MQLSDVMPTANNSLVHAECTKGANLVHACVGIAMSLLFALISLILAIADGSDLNPHSKALYASPCGNWTFRRAFIKSALPLLAAALPNYIHLRASVTSKLPHTRCVSLARLACSAYTSMYVTSTSSFCTHASH